MDFPEGHITYSFDTNRSNMSPLALFILNFYSQRPWRFPDRRCERKSLKRGSISTRITCGHQHSDKSVEMPPVKLEAVILKFISRIAKSKKFIPVKNSRAKLVDCLFVMHSVIDVRELKCKNFNMFKSCLMIMLMINEKPKLSDNRFFAGQHIGNRYLGLSHWESSYLPIMLVRDLFIGITTLYPRNFVVVLFCFFSLCYA